MHKDEDPFLAAEDGIAVHELIDKTMAVHALEGMMFPVCLDAASDNSEEEFFGSLAQENPGASDEEEKCTK